MECHSTAAAAPPAMLAIYGSGNGFGWQLNEVVGAQIVSVPASLPFGSLDRAFQNLLIDMCLVALVTLIAVDLALILIVVRPVSKLSEMADRISKGELDEARTSGARKRRDCRARRLLRSHADQHGEGHEDARRRIVTCPVLAEEPGAIGGRRDLRRHRLVQLPGVGGMFGGAVDDDLRHGADVHGQILHRGFQHGGAQGSRAGQAEWRRGR